MTYNVFGGMLSLTQSINQSSQNAKILKRQYLQNSKSSQVEIWSSTWDH